MKAVLFVFSFCFCSLHALAQDYSLFPSNQTLFFAREDSSTNAYTLYPDNCYNDFTISGIVETKFDSSTQISGGTTLFPFRTWRDTSFYSGLDIGYLNGPSWLGAQITQLNNGMCYLENERGDTIEIRQLALPGDSWIFLEVNENKAVHAFVDSIGLASFTGIVDSLKYIHLEVHDSSNQLVVGEPLNWRKIILSKNHGLVEGITIRELPDYNKIVRTDSVPTVFQNEIYDFDPGDQFEYQYPNEFYPGIPAGHVLYTILDKWFNLNGDTVYYSRSGIQQFTHIAYDSLMNPYLSTETGTFNDTVNYIFLNQPLYSYAPEQNGILQDGSFGVYALNKKYNRYEFTESRCVNDSFSAGIALFDHFEPQFRKVKYVTGLGNTYFRFDASSPSVHEYYFLEWYSKGTESNGQYVDLTTLAPEIIPFDFSIYPNPTKGTFTVSLNSPGEYHIQLISIQGQILKTFTQIEKSMQYSIEDLAHGMYFLLIEKDGIKNVQTITLN